MHSVVLINGTETEYFKLSKSIRLGDGISMNFFVLTVVPFANLIRQNNNIERVIIPNQPPKKISHYCDDKCILTTKAESIKTIVKVTNIFEKCARGHQDKDKTEIVLFWKVVGSREKAYTNK